MEVLNWTMSRRINRIRNPDFARGQTEPSGWTWEATTRSIRWKREPDRGQGRAGMLLSSGSMRASGHWWQTVVCKPQQYYRIEATVSADLTPENRDEFGDGAGVVLTVEPVKNDKPTDQRRTTPGICRASGPVTIRTYYQTPEGIRRLRIHVGVSSAKGSARIHHVRFIEMLDPDEESNILAIPAPPHAVPAPKVARRVCVCSASADDRPITGLLSQYFGTESVARIAADELRPQSIKTDAILLPDAQPPSPIGSLTALKMLAKGRIVVISLKAFARLAGDALSIRRVQQEDDPICAKVTYANHATRGFALHDTFSFAWPGSAPGSFVQNHFRRSQQQKAFFKKHGLVTLLESVCDRDSTCDRPVCLYHATENGGLYVMDIEPAEATASTFGEPVLAMHLLLSILGQAQNGLGQYVVPAEEEYEFRELIREAGIRFDPFVVHDSDLPVQEVEEQSVVIGREEESFGLPLTPKPMIVVRSGLVPGDVESAYGAFVWFKQLVRMVPHACPYAEQVAAQFRLAWVPWQTTWNPRQGWRRDVPSRTSGDGTIPPNLGPIALVVDLVSVPGNGVGVVLPSHEAQYQRYVHWLPRLFATFAPGRYFVPTVEDGAAFADRDAFRWRLAQHKPELIIDPGQFQSRLHRKVLDEGGQAVRIEVPACDADFAAYSIQRTDLVATLLEQVIGLQYGLIAVNRSALPVSFNGFSPVAPGESLVVHRQDPMLRAAMSQVG